MAKNINNAYLKLQEAIAECYEIEKRKTDIPLAIQEKKSILNSGKAHHSELIAKSKQFKEYIEKNAKDLEEIRDKRVSAEQKIEKVATQREFDAENAILEKCKIDEHNKREQTQKLEKRLEQLQDKIKESEELVKALAISTEEEIKELESKTSGIDEELKKAKAKKDKLSVGVSPELLFKFERIIKNKGGIGRVSLKSGVCQGCHMELPQQFVNKVRLNEEIEFCPYCSRILSYEESDVDMEIAESDSKYYANRKDEDEDIELDGDIIDREESQDIQSDEDMDPVEAMSHNLIADESEFDL